MLTNILNNEQVVETQIEKAAQWLLKSGVQVKSTNPLHHQGFACWYDAETQTMPYAYSEITGYLVTMMCALFEETGDPDFLSSASGAGNWLVRTTHEETGGFRCLYPLHSTQFDYKHNQIYTFDCGVILSGLVNLFRATGKAGYLASAVTVADWMIREAQKPNGGFYPVYNIDTGSFVESDKEWSLCSGGYHTKVALGLINLYDATGHEKYKLAAVKACNFALTFQQPDGRFVTFPGEGGTNTHPHAYAAEGLWVVGSILGRDDYLNASAKATRWLLDWQSPEGIIPRHFHDGQPLYNERVDILSQTLRLATIHLGEGRLTATMEMQGKLEKLAQVILRNQASSPDERINGGFYFGRLSDGSTVPHINVWVTAFAIQGLKIYSSVLNNTYKFNPFFMV